MTFYPAPKGLHCLPCQRRAIPFALEQEDCFIADEMELGKTVDPRACSARCARWLSRCRNGETIICKQNIVTAETDSDNNPRKGTAL